MGDFSRGDEIEVDVAADGERLDFRVLTSSAPSRRRPPGASGHRVDDEIGVRPVRIPVWDLTGRILCILPHYATDALSISPSRLAVLAPGFAAAQAPTQTRPVGRRRLRDAGQHRVPRADQGHRRRAPGGHRHRPENGAQQPDHEPGDQRPVRDEPVRGRTSR